MSAEVVQYFAGIIDQKLKGLSGVQMRGARSSSTQTHNVSSAGATGSGITLTAAFSVAVMCRL